jgi:Tol biopolymer transport system component
MGIHRRFIYTLVAAVALLVPASAEASFPGANGRIFFAHAGGTTWSMNPDGSDPSQVSDQAISGPWSRTGTMMVHENPLGSPADFTVWSANGSKVTDVSVPDDGHNPSWSPDGRIVYNATREVCAPSFCEEDPVGVWVVNMDGTGNTQLMNDGIQPAFSPDGDKIAFIATNSAGGYSIYVANPDGSSRVPIASGAITTENRPEWSPDSRRIGFIRIWPRYELWSIAADGSDERQLTFTDNQERALTWSPDGSKIAASVSDPTLSASAGIYMLNAGDGSGLTKLRDDGGVVFWQPIPYTGYPRPRGATPTYASLVPAYVECTSPNITHGGPLAYPSCTQKNFSHQDGTMQLVSPNLDMGSPDWNGAAAKFIGSVRLDVHPGDPRTPTDEADVGIRVSTTDIRCSNRTQTTACGSANIPAGADYVGELQGNLTLRITDRDNTPDPSGSGPGTMIDTPFRFAVPCTETSGDQTEGSSCATTTSADAVAPGVVTEGKRAIWQLGQVQVYDGGSDGLASTTADNTLFLDQGVFVP